VAMVAVDSQRQADGADQEASETGNREIKKLSRAAAVEPRAMAYRAEQANAELRMKY